MYRKKIKSIIKYKDLNKMIKTAERIYEPFEKAPEQM